MDRLFNDLKGTPKIEKIFEAIEESIGVNPMNILIRMFCLSPIPTEMLKKRLKF